MTVQEAIGNIHAPKGLTSVLNGLMSGDYSVLPHEKGIGADLKTAEENVAKYQKQLAQCTSDWSYWSILGDKAYWEAVRDILEAATIVGPDNLPDVEKPNFEGLVVMDSISRVTTYGRTILSKAHSIKKGYK